MFIKMKESKGFTLVELMIVVAIIGILAAVAVPFYQRYVEKSRLTTKIYPGMHAIQTNVAAFYSFQKSMPQGATDTLPAMFADANTKCFDPTFTASGTLEVRLKTSADCKFHSLADDSMTLLTLKAETSGGKIVGWVMSGKLATSLGLGNEK